MEYIDYAAEKFSIFKTYILIFEGCDSESPPITTMPLSLIFPVKGILNNSSSSASDSTNYKYSFRKHAE